MYPSLSKSSLCVGLQIDKLKAKGAMKEIAIAKASVICVAWVDVFDQLPSSWYPLWPCKW